MKLTKLALLAEPMQVTFVLTRQTICSWLPASQIAIVASRFADASQTATMPAMAMHVTEVVIQQAAELRLVIVVCAIGF